MSVSTTSRWSPWPSASSSRAAGMRPPQVSCCSRLVSTTPVDAAVVGAQDVVVVEHVDRARHVRVDEEPARLRGASARHELLPARHSVGPFPQPLRRSPPT